MDNIYITRAVDKFQHYPAEDNDYQFGFQVHWATVAHGDLRFEYGNPEKVLGITLAIAKPGLKRPNDLQDFREQIEDPDNWKMDFATGNFALRRKRGSNTETYIYSKKKVPEAIEWLHLSDYEADPGHAGATDKQKGYILLVDSGEIEHLAKKPYAFEFMLHGKTLNGRYLFRQFRGIVSRYTGASDTNTLYEGQNGYLFIKAKDQTPYVLNNRAIALRWLPPVGVSALPKEIRNAVPPQLRYWREEDNEKALELRRQLREHLLKEGVIHSNVQTDFAASAKSGEQFAISYQSFKGATKSVRAGHSFAYWNIFIDSGEQMFAFKCWQDPIDNPSVSVELLEGYQYKGALDFQGKAEAGHPINATHNMESYVEILDKGAARLKEDTTNRKVFELSGNTVRGTYVINKEEGADIWVMTRR